MKFFLLIISIFFFSNAFADGNKLIILGAAPTSGSYWPVSNSICNAVNFDKISHKFRCLPSITGGSVYNINGVLQGELDVGLTKAHILYEQYHETDDGKSLRMISNLYKEPIFIVVKKNGPIKSFDDIQNTTSINVGNLGSGKRVVADKIFDIMNWNTEDFTNTFDYTTNESMSAFCNNELDVMIEAVGLPNANYDYLAKECDATYIDLKQNIIDSFTKNPFYTEYSIPTEIAFNNINSVKTVNSNIVLFTKKENSNEMIYSLVSSLFSNFGMYKDSLPLLSQSTEEYYSQGSILTPLHEGADNFYREYFSN